MGMIKKSIGKNTIGDGKKMQVEFHTYNRSTQNLSYVFRNTQGNGTLVPFMSELMLPGDIFDITLDPHVDTHPTVGPLYGSYKLQLDVYTVPLRLYQKELMINKLGTGRDMKSVKLPTIKVSLPSENRKWGKHEQISSSCLLKYLGLSGYGVCKIPEGIPERVGESVKQAVPLVGYWDIYKNYYANKQEERGFFMGRGNGRFWGVVNNPDEINDMIRENVNEVKQQKLIGEASIVAVVGIGNAAVSEEEFLNYEIWYNELGRRPDTNSPRITKVKLSEIVREDVNGALTKHDSRNNATYAYLKEPFEKGVKLLALVNFGTYPTEFKLEQIDNIREDILEQTPGVSYMVNSGRGGNIVNEFTNQDASGNYLSSYKQFGLGLKTYQSDIFNNWINTEWVDGETGITAMTSIDVSSGKLTMDSLNLAKKVYEMLNRIAVSDGTYKSWLETVYTNEYIERSSTPVYEGGCSNTIVFQEVISTAANVDKDQPLGTLAGRGKTMDQQHGGKLHVKADEPCYLMGIVSITPYIDYDCGNKWDLDILSMDEFHKPALDGIGFQDCLQNWADWRTDEVQAGTNKRILKSFGKTPAWINYTTNVNRVYGNFAEENNEDFMVMLRDYEVDDQTAAIKDATTYIDPVKYNRIFADESRDSMNFWLNVGVKIIARRKMSARIIPNL